jgi:hypothetical protein
MNHGGDGELEQLKPGPGTDGGSIAGNKWHMAAIQAIDGET